MARPKAKAISHRKASPRKSPASIKRRESGKPASAVVEFNGTRYKRVGRSFGTTWEPKKAGEVLEGTVTSLQQVANKLARKGQDPMQWCMEVQDAEGSAWTVWESSSLREFMNEAQIGNEVRVEFQGLIPIKGGKKFKAFAAYIAE
jgi:hypothetical protein